MRNWGRSGRTRYPEMDAYVFGFHQVEPSVEWMLVRSGTVTPGYKAWYRTTNKEECLSRCLLRSPPPGCNRSHLSEAW